MATTRLNESHRRFLRALADKSVVCIAEERAEDAAYKKAAPLVRKIVEAKWPVKDMRLLQKYEVAHHDGCIKLQLTAGGIEQFQFREGDRSPLRPGTWDCSQQIHAADAVATEAIGALILAAETHKDARKKKLDDYHALISASTTLEQVEEVWPAAVALRERIGRALPSVLSNDVIERIRADVALSTSEARAE